MATIPRSTVDPHLKHEPFGFDPYAAKPGSPEIEQVEKDIQERMDSRVLAARRHRGTVEKRWQKNVLAYAGQQWLVWDPRGSGWRRPLYDQKKIGPLPVTNKLAIAIDDNISSLVQEQPTIDWVPEADRPEDIATAEVADRVDLIIAEEVGRRKAWRDLAAWVVTCGSAFVESGYDPDPKHGTVFMQYEQCRSCHYVGKPDEFVADGGAKACPRCGSDDIQQAREVAGASCPECQERFPPDGVGAPCPACALRNEQFQHDVVTGAIVAGDLPMAVEASEFAPPDPPLLKPMYGSKPIGEDVPRGRMFQRIRSPFEVFFDHIRYTNFEEAPWVDLVDLIDEHTAVNDYGFDPSEGEQPRHRSGADAVGFGTAMQHLESLARRLDESNSSPMSSGAAVDDKSIVREIYYEKESTRYPQGLMVVRLGGNNGKIVQWGPLLFQDNKGGRFIPVVHVKFRPRPGNAYGKSAADDILPLQIRRNLTELAMNLAERRLTNGLWMVPKGSLDGDVDLSQIGGYIEYNIVGDGTRQYKPEREPGIEPPIYFIRRLEMLDADIEKMAGSFGVAHGEAPKGVTAASALALLGERQQRAVSPQVESWELAIERIAFQQMMIFRQFAADPRTLPSALSGPNNIWKVEIWSSADLRGAVQARVQRGSASPKSNAQAKGSIEVLVNLGFIDPQDPVTRYRVLEVFEETNLIEHMDADIRDARRENERFMRLSQDKPGGAPYHIRPEIDNHEVHLQEMIKLAKSDEFRELERRALRAEQSGQMDDPSIILVRQFYGHLAEHKEIIMRDIEVERSLAGEEPGPGPGRPPGGGAVFARAPRHGREEDARSVIEPSMPTA